jgi:predicted dehydrogenase
MDRREFLQAGMAMTGGMVLPWKTTQTEPIRIGIVGTGWWGTDVLLKSALATRQFTITALCDVNEDALSRAAEQVVNAGQIRPRTFTSHNEMFDFPELDAVVISTPTHWHALQFIDACKRNLHVFLEKPICYDIREGQAMLEWHKRTGNVVQVDFPRIMTNINTEVRAFIGSGEAGKIRQVLANINHPDGPIMEKITPASIDFETFCGPAPKKKFLCLPDNNTPMWRGQHDFSRGILFDWGIHYLHNIRKTLGLDLPDSVHAMGGTTKNFTQDLPDHLDVHFDYKGLPVYWSHKTWGFTSPNPDNNVGVYYYGEKATIFVGDMGWEVYPAGGGKIVHGDIRFNSSEPNNWRSYLTMAENLLKEFASQVRRRSNEGISNKLEDAFVTTASVIYGDMSYLCGMPLSIDKNTMSTPGNERAQTMLKRNYRAPYIHPYMKD